MQHKLKQDWGEIQGSFYVNYVMFATSLFYAYLHYGTEKRQFVKATMSTISVTI